MIDIHCHLLPGIDDGPQNMAEAVDLARQSVSDGVTHAVVTGQFGDLAQTRARQLLEMGVVTVLASDAHHVKRRPVNLHEGRNAAAEIIDADLADALVYGNPLEIVGNQFA